MLPICTSGPRIKVKVVVRLNPIILLNRQGSLGLWGHAPSGKYKYYNFFVLIASSCIKFQSKGDDRGSGLMHWLEWLYRYCTVTSLRG